MTERTDPLENWHESDVDHHPRLRDRESAAASAVIALADAIPPGSVFVLVDEGFLNIAPLLSGRTCLRFNPGRPAAEADVLQQFAALRKSGATFVVFAWPALWWLHHYRALNDGIQSVMTRVHAGDGFVAFELRPDRPVETVVPAPDPAAAAVESLRRRSADLVHSEWRLAVRDILDRVIAVDAVILVVTSGDDTLLRLGRHKGWHFPRLDDGSYAGHPTDSDEALRHLAVLQAKGARYLFVPAWSGWWLEFYGGVRHYLEASSTLVWKDETCVLYDLWGDGAPNTGEATNAG